MGLMGADLLNHALPFRFSDGGRLGRSVGLHPVGIGRASRAKADEEHYRESEGDKGAKGDKGVQTEGVRESARRRQASRA